MRNTEFARTSFDGAMGVFKRIQSNDARDKEGTLALGLSFPPGDGVVLSGSGNWGRLRQASGGRQESFRAVESSTYTGRTAGNLTLSTPFGRQSLLADILLTTCQSVEDATGVTSYR